MELARGPLSMVWEGPHGDYSEIVSEILGRYVMTRIDPATGLPEFVRNTLASGARATGAKMLKLQFSEQAQQAWVDNSMQAPAGAWTIVNAESQVVAWSFRSDSDSHSSKAVPFPIGWTLVAMDATGDVFWQEEQCLSMRPFYKPIASMAAASSASSSAAAAASDSGGAEHPFVTQARRIKAETVKEEEQPQDELSGPMFATMLSAASVEAAFHGKVDASTAAAAALAAGKAIQEVMASWHPASAPAGALAAKPFPRVVAKPRGMASVVMTPDEVDKPRPSSKADAAHKVAGARKQAEQAKSGVPTPPPKRQRALIAKVPVPPQPPLAPPPMPAGIHKPPPLTPSQPKMPPPQSLMQPLSEVIDSLRSDRRGGNQPGGNRGGWFSKAQVLCKAVITGHPRTEAIAQEWYAGAEPH